MKKFAKFCGITAGILLIFGIALSLISVAAGGYRMIQEIYGGNYQKDLEQGAGRFGRVISAIMEEFTEEEFETEGDVMSNPGAKEQKGDQAGTTAGTAYEVPADQIWELELELGAGEFFVETLEGKDQIEITYQGEGKCNYYVKNGVLHVEGFKSAKLFQNHQGGELRIGIPSGLVLRELSVELGAGKMTIRNVETQEFDVEAGAGTLQAENVHTINADMSVGMGEIVFSGAITGNLEAECGMGNLDMMLEGSQQEHNYEIECAAGNLEIEGLSVSGLATQRLINNHAASTYEISCSMGNVTLNWK